MKLFNHCQTSTAAVEFHPTLYNACNYLSMSGLKLFMFVKGSPDFTNTAHYANNGFMLHYGVIQVWF